jgi:lysyl-tRNA synthetase class 2
MSDTPGTLEADRRAKLEAIRSLGIDPFGQRVAGVIPLESARASHTEGDPPEGRAEACVAGRIIFRRDIGKLVFIRLRDESGELQIGLDKKRLEATDPKLWQLAGLLDLGDQIVVKGLVGKTKTGEITVWASTLDMAAKSLLPPPAKWEGLTDVEARYRQRYVDLFANPEVMKLAQQRIRIVDEIRAFLRSRGYLEVETPMMQIIHGGAAARPFKTHHNALDLPLYMRIAPELYLKRLLVGGMRKVFEVNRNFRNEGVSPRHNPEFTMLEAYDAFGSWETMAEMVEEMICTVAQNVLGTLVIQHGGTEGTESKTIDLSQRPWRRMSMAELVEEKTGWRFDKSPIAPERLAEIREHNPGKDLKRHDNPAEQLVEIYEKLVEPTLINPCFVTRVPGVIIPLAWRCRDDDYFADVYELVINGQEISPGYTELNDPDVQAEHFRHQVGDREEQQQVDEDFLTALKYGMPPAGGMGMGIDRLVMMLTGAPSIRDVILFPLMRPR